MSAESGRAERRSRGSAPSDHANGWSRRWGRDLGPLAGGSGDTDRPTALPRTGMGSDGGAFTEVKQAPGAGEHVCR